LRRNYSDVDDLDFGSLLLTSSSFTPKDCCETKSLDGKVVFIIKTGNEGGDWGLRRNGVQDWEKTVDKCQDFSNLQSPISMI
jgi:hypothetical protein